MLYGEKAVSPIALSLKLKRHVPDAVDWQALLARRSAALFFCLIFARPLFARPLSFLDISSRLEISKIRGHSPATTYPSQVHASGFSSRVGLSPPFTRRVSSNVVHSHTALSALKAGIKSTHGDI